MLSISAVPGNSRCFNPVRLHRQLLFGAGRPARRLPPHHPLGKHLFLVTTVISNKSSRLSSIHTSYFRQRSPVEQNLINDRLLFDTGDDQFLLRQYAIYGNCTQVSTGPRSDQCHLKHLAALEAELRKALENQQFHLHYQVQVDDLKHPLGAEALIRWSHPNATSYHQINSYRWQKRPG